MSTQGVNNAIQNRLQGAQQGVRNVAALAKANKKNTAGIIVVVLIVIVAIVLLVVWLNREPVGPGPVSDNQPQPLDTDEPGADETKFKFMDGSFMKQTFFKHLLRSRNTVTSNMMSNLDTSMEGVSASGVYKTVDSSPDGTVISSFNGSELILYDDGLVAKMGNTELWKIDFEGPTMGKINNKGNFNFSLRANKRILWGVDPNLPEGEYKLAIKDGQAGVFDTQDYLMWGFKENAQSGCMSSNLHGKNHILYYFDDTISVYARDGFAQSYNKIKICLENGKLVEKRKGNERVLAEDPKAVKFVVGPEGLDLLNDQGVVLTSYKLNSDPKKDEFFQPQMSQSREGIITVGDDGHLYYHQGTWTGDKIPIGTNVKVTLNPNGVTLKGMQTLQF